MKVLPSMEKFSALGAEARPAPTNAPVKPCVVEMGNPRKLASRTVAPAPPATASTNWGDPTMASGTSPFPEKFRINVCAKNRAVRLPKNVATVAQEMAAR